MTIDIENGVKAYKLKDENGQVMFIVAVFRECRHGEWIVKVREITDLYVPRDIIREYYRDYETAMEHVKLLVRDYTNLIASMQRKMINPRVVFDDAVDYHRITPNCCLNCEYSIVDFQPPKEGRKPHPPMLRCTQRKNMKQYEQIWDDFGEDGIRNHGQNWPYSPIQVDCNGICNNYVGPKCGRYDRTRKRWEGKGCYENDRDLIDLINTIYDNKIRIFEDQIFVRPDGTYNQQFECGVIDITGREISSGTLSASVSKAVDNAISGGQISSSIVNIVNNVVENIEISSIIGNRNVQDYNSDGIIDEDEEAAYIIGGMGA